MSTSKRTYWTGTLAPVPHTYNIGDIVDVNTRVCTIVGTVKACLHWGTAAGYRVEYAVNDPTTGTRTMRTIDVDQRDVTQHPTNQTK